MGAGDILAGIAETQVGTRGDLQTGRAALYGYLLATHASLSAFQPEWARSGFGPSPASRLSLLGVAPAVTTAPGLLGPGSGTYEPPVILRVHSWCAAFVDWCVLQLLTGSPQATCLTFSHRPTTASAFELLNWGKASGCTVFEGNGTMPERGDIAVFAFSHTGIVTHSEKGQFSSVEGNTAPAGGSTSNQGYMVEKRWRKQHLLKGLIRLPEPASSTGASRFDWSNKGFARAPQLQVAPRQGTSVYRCFDGTHSTEWGSGYFSLHKPESVFDAELRFNIVEWGNLVRFVSTFRIRGGFHYYVGPVAHGEHDLRRAASQVYVEPPLAIKLELLHSRELLKQDAVVLPRKDPGARRSS